MGELMRKLFGFIAAFVIIVIAGLWLMLMAFPGLFINNATIVKFQDEFNKQYDWIDVSFQPEEIDISYDSGFFYKPHYRIKIPKISADFEYKKFVEPLMKGVVDKDYKLPDELDFAGMNIKAGIDEAVFIYGPFDKYAAIRSAQNISLINDEDDNVSDYVNLSLGSVDSNDINISPILKDSGDLKNLYKVVIKYLEVLGWDYPCVKVLLKHTEE